MKIIIKNIEEYIQFLCCLSAEVDVSLVNNEQIHQINLEQRDVDMPTDVLSFPLGENGAYEKNPATGAYMLGDIVLSLERAASQAEEFGHSVRREYAFLIAHSVLHLTGYDHMEEEERMVMEQKQRDIMERLNILR